MRVIRFPTNPIITPEMDSRIGANINGPSLLRVPDWLPDPLGRYYLYFGHHQGEFIRLAYADDLAGPWTVYVPGTLALDETPCHGHIASPDVHVDDANRRIVMYYHGPALSREQQDGDPLTQAYPFLGGQRTFVATSEDGIHFTSQREVLGPSYFRSFRYGGWVYALGMPGIFFRSRDGFTGFERGPIVFGRNQRHTAVKVDGDTLTVFYSVAGDCPEHIVASTVDLRPDWLSWQASEQVSVLLPEEIYEGADLPLVASKRGAIHARARQLRDPAIFEEEGRTFLLYSVAGESGIAVAEYSSE
ncbi:MAG: hypothetical protein KDD84_18850 [Caldilineaceae bacterium]|nr:hypothetical protein [Caldilineaceae bacterium]